MSFQEKGVGEHPGWMKPIRELGVQIVGTELEAVIEQFKAELTAAGINKLKPTFYLSDEWGVPFDTTAIAIPFYLARTDLIDLHAVQAGFIEGASPRDLLRYLRHEMGHVVNYGYKLYEREDWVKLFGSIDQPYVEEYRPVPFHRSYVQHLPGWYAQKHPDEDWAETFAIWMTPGADWRGEYTGQPLALAKLEYCERTLNECANLEPLVTSDETDEAVEAMTCSLEDYYRNSTVADDALPPGLDGSLRAIFLSQHQISKQNCRAASVLLRSVEKELLADVYRWTGHFPERTRILLRYLARRADELELAYEPGDETKISLAVATFITALAMNHVLRGTYVP
ncbi:putative zinc-binding metallopeptidase [soil metagenome]